VAAASRPPMYCTRVSVSGRAAWSGSSSGAVLEVKKATLRATPRLVSGCWRRRGGGHRGGDAGDDFDFDAGFLERAQFLVGAAEQHRVAAFQAHHQAELAGAVDQLFVDQGCAVERWPERLPTEIFSACGHSASISGVTSASYSTTSACASRRAPRTVMRSAAPGPAPIR
jgi:hypothetical protein